MTLALIRRRYAAKNINIDRVGINKGGGVVGWKNEGECQHLTAELLRGHY